MNLLKEDRLPFDKIAHEWARELEEAKIPGRRNRNEILQKLLNAVRRGEFDNVLLMIEQSPRNRLEKTQQDGKGGQEEWSRVKPPPMRVTRETLAKVLLLRSGVGRVEPDSDLKLSDCEPLSLRTWIEPLTVSREHFGRWCDDYGHARPAFWFGDTGREPDQKQAKVQPVHHVPIERDQDLQTKLKIVIQKANDLRAGHKDWSDESIAAQLSKIPNIGYSRETLRKIVRGTYPLLKRLGISR